MLRVTLHSMTAGLRRMQMRQDSDDLVNTSFSSGNSETHSTEKVTSAECETSLFLMSGSAAEGFDLRQ